MTNLSIRKLLTTLFDALRRRAPLNRRSMAAEVGGILERSSTPAPPLDQARLRRLQARAILAFGGRSAASGKVERFIAERPQDWGAGR